MAATWEQEEAMKKKYEGMRNQGSALEQLRAWALSRGVTGIRTIAVIFRRLDQNRDKKMDFREFQDGLRECGIQVSASVAKECFDKIDSDGSGTINFDEFLIALRPPLSDSRMKLIDAAFKKLDKTGDGIVNIHDLKGVYSAEFHPKYQSGEWTEQQVLENWLSNFSKTAGNYQITRDDFINYYVGVSSSIDEDQYFVLMMTKAWKL